MVLCTSSAIINKAGVNVNQDLAASNAIISQLIDEADGRICAETRYDWENNNSGIKPNFNPV